MSDGRVGTLSPRSRSLPIDPFGVSPYTLELMQQYPAGNDPQSSPDRGLNFPASASMRRRLWNNRTYVAKTDFNLDREGRHTLMLRGTLADTRKTPPSAQFPGQDPRPRRSTTRKVWQLRYTTVITNSLVNVASYG